MFSFPYVKDFRELREEFARRSAGNVRERARRYLLEKFGFDMDDADDEYIGGIAHEPNIGAYRHHKSPYLEGIVLELLSQALGVENGTLTYMHDQYDDRNQSKRAMIEIREMREGEERGSKIGNAYNAQVLSNIKTHDGKPVYSYHLELLQSHGYSLPAGDFSEVFSEFLASALQHLSPNDIRKHFGMVFVVEEEEINGEKILVRKPYFFKKKEKHFKNRESGNEISVEDLISLAERGEAFPSARTYYNYLLLFLPGNLYPQHAQYVTPFEEDDEKIMKAAAEGVKRVKEVTGEYPLHVVIPNLKEDAYKYILEGVDELSKKIKIPDLNDSSNLYRVASETYEELMKYAGTGKKA